MKSPSLACGHLAVLSRFVVAAVVTCAPVALAGCKSCDSASSAPDAAPAAAVEAPVPAPDGLLAEAVLTTPNATWTRLQRNLGGPIAILPSTFGGLVCSLAGLDLAVAAELDGAAPAYAAVADDPSGTPASVLAVKMRDARHVRAILAEAETARFVASEKGALTVLAPKGAQGSANGAPIVALTKSGYMLVATRASDLERLGPYAYRTLPTHAAPPEALVVDVPKSALAGPAKKQLERLWTAFRDDKLAQYEAMRDAKGGKEPDFGDPPAILAAAGGAVEGATGFVGDLDGVHLALDATEGELRLTATAHPNAPDPAAGGNSGRAAKAIASLRPGDAQGALAAPRTSPAVLVMRDDAAARADTASSLDGILAKVLGPRLPADAQKKVRATLDAWAKARGDVTTAALSAADPRGVAFRIASTDGDGADHALHDGVELLKLPAFREPLRGATQIRDITFATEDAPGLTKISVARFTRDAPAKGVPVVPSGIAWHGADGAILVGVGERPAELVARMNAPEGRLSEDAAVVEAVKRLGDKPAVTVIAQPSRFGIGAPGQAIGPIVVAWGRSGGDGWGRVELPYAVLKDALRRVTGF